MRLRFRERPGVQDKINVFKFLDNCYTMNILFIVRFGRCLWFLMEPLIKNEKYSYSFYRRMIENIKQTKDKQNPDDLDLNYVSI